MIRGVVGSGTCAREDIVVERMRIGLDAAGLWVYISITLVGVR
jgi:hypothetical protein